MLLQTGRETKLQNTFVNRLETDVNRFIDTEFDKKYMTCGSLLQIFLF